MNGSYITEKEEKEKIRGNIMHIKGSKEYFEKMGYTCVRQMKNGLWVGLLIQIYTVGLCVDLGEWGYERRYCYERYVDALVAVCQYEDEGDPIGPWIKMKSERGDRLGPGVKGEIEYDKEERSK